MLRWLLLLASFAAAPAAAQEAHEHHPSGKPPAANAKSDPEYARFTTEMTAGMNTMMKDMHAQGYAGNVDIDFLVMMIPHHEGAVEMARLVLIHGRDSLTRKLAEEIIASQVVEIEGMKRRLAILRANTEAGAGEFPALGGTRGPAK